MVRLGLIGVGRWGRNYVRTVSAMPGVSLVHCASSNPETARLTGTGCRMSSDWRTVLEDPELDGVIVATPAPTHYEIARAALARGLSVLVEKPLTMDVREAEALLALARQADAFALVGHIDLFNPAFEALRLRLPELGPIRSLRGSASRYGPFRRSTPVLWEWGPHFVAMSLDLMGERPHQARAELLEHRDVDGGLGQTVRLRLDFPNGVRADHELSNLRPERARELELRFDDRRVVYDDVGPDALVVTPEDGWAESVRTAAGVGAGAGTGSERGSEDSPLTREVARFVRGVRSAERDLSSLSLAVEVTAVLAECERSLRDTS